MVNLRQLFRSGYKLVNLSYRRCALKIAKFLFSFNKVSSRITLGYCSGMKIDGLGAQLQRILAINALGEYWNVQVQHPRVEQVAIHPLDGINSRQDYLNFLDNLNYIIESNADSEKLHYSHIMCIDELSLSQLIIIYLRLIILRHKVYLKITQPYFFIDSMPSLYKCSYNTKVQERLSFYATMNQGPRISLHHRHGVGNMAIQPGQNKPREIDLAVFLDVLEKICKVNSNMGVVIFTDAPEESFEFSPLDEQKASWLGLPAFDGHVMRISGNSLNKLLEILPPNSEVIRGGNPIKTLADMASNPIQVLSRSSFSYVAALLSKEAEIWIPCDFWHPGLSEWKSYAAYK
jgi:hypothetical protein